MIRATPDTNVIVSGLMYRRGKPHEPLQRALSGEISLTVSQAILEEVADVLKRKFSATAEEVNDAREIISHAARTVRPSVQLNVIQEDPPDNRILECAVSGGADYIVSVDKDLLRLGQYDSIRILNVSDFLDEIKRF